MVPPTNQPPHPHNPVDQMRLPTQLPSPLPLGRPANHQNNALSPPILATPSDRIHSGPGDNGNTKQNRRMTPTRRRDCSATQPKKRVAGSEGSRHGARGKRRTSSEWRWRSCSRTMTRQRFGPGSPPQRATGTGLLGWQTPLRCGSEWTEGCQG